MVPAAGAQGLSRPLARCPLPTGDKEVVGRCAERRGQPLSMPAWMDLETESAVVPVGRRARGQCPESLSGQPWPIVETLPAAWL